MLRGFNLIKEPSQAFTIDTAERDHRASGSAENNVGNRSPWQLAARQAIADVGGRFLGTDEYRSEASAVGKIRLGHAAPRLSKYPGRKIPIGRISYGGAHEKGWAAVILGRDKLPDRFCSGCFPHASPHHLSSSGKHSNPC